MFRVGLNTFVHVFVVGNVVAFHDKCTDSIRHVKCQYLFHASSKHRKTCPVCSNCRSNYLRSSLSRFKKSNEQNEPCCPSSHANYCFMTNEQKDQRLRQLHTQLCAKTRALETLQKTVREIFARECIQIDPSTSDDLLSIMRTYSKTALSKCKDSSFQSLLWEQQLKASSLCKPKSMRLHPLVIYSIGPVEHMKHCEAAE